MLPNLHPFAGASHQRFISYLKKPSLYRGCKAITQLCGFGEWFTGGGFLTNFQDGGPQAIKETHFL